MVRRVLFSRVTKQSRKGILPFSSISLVNWMLVFCSFKCSFYYKIDFFKIFSKGHNESLPELLSNKTPGGVNVGCMNGYIQSLWFYVENTNLMLTQYSMTNGVTFPC